MGKEEILGKIDRLVEPVRTQGRFEERDVVYLLVEAYKIEERELHSTRREIRTALPCLSFYRDWVVHTHMHDEEWVRRKEELSDPSRLLKELLSLIKTKETSKNIGAMWPSFVEALELVTADQNISSR